MDILTRLKGVFDSVFEGEVDSAGIGETDSLKEDLKMNSIGMLYMAMAIEEEFGVKFTNDDFAAMSTVGDVIAVIERKI